MTDGTGGSVDRGEEGVQEEIEGAGHPTPTTQPWPMRARLDPSRTCWAEPARRGSTRMARPSHPARALPAWPAWAGRGGALAAGLCQRGLAQAPGSGSRAPSGGRAFKALGAGTGTGTWWTGEWEDPRGRRGDFEGRGILCLCFQGTTG